jgi:hypothetical protein
LVSGCRLRAETTKRTSPLRSTAHPYSILPPMPRRPRLKVIDRNAALLAGKVARQSDRPRSHVAEYLDFHHRVEPLDELACAWLEGWDDGDRIERERERSPFRR